MTSRTLSLGLVGMLLAAGLACSSPPLYSGAGGACSATKPCAPGLTCANGVCVASPDGGVLPVCASGAKRCEGSNVETCKSDGSGWTVSTQCAAGCDPTTVACHTQICDPKSPSATGSFMQCQGNEVMVCKADGTGWAPKEKCQYGCDPTTAACIAGVCVPYQQRCLPDGTIQACKSDGSGWGTAQACNGNCVDNGQTGAKESANCLETSCTPNALRCDGLSLVQCAADGSAETVVTTCPHECSVVSSVAECVDAACHAGDTRCSVDGKSVERCNALGTAWDSTSCAGDSGSGTCTLSIGTGPGGSDTASCVAPICQAGQATCSAGILLTCSADGLSQTQTSCAYGCLPDGSGCAQPACNTNETRCDPSASSPSAAGTALQVCAPNRQGFVFDQYCAAGCVAGANGGSPAHCAFNTCSPLLSRCTPDGQVQTCSADGTQWGNPQACPTGEICSTDACAPPPAACDVGATRCNGGDLETCVAGPPTGYTKLGSCIGTCQGDGCDALGECGPISLSIPTVVSKSNLPADGQSTFLVVSAPLVGPDGRPVPDGTMVTVAADSPSNPAAVPRLLAGDADPTAPGLQIQVVDDRIDFEIGAPSLASGTVQSVIKAQLGDHAPCSGALSVTFDASVTDRYVGEDFTTTRTRDGSGPVTQWNTQTGTLTLNAFDAGDGRDGDLDVPANTTVDLSQHVQPGRAWPDMASARVLEIDGDRVSIDADPAPFAAPGTRVLIINIQGGLNHVSSVGAYETATVAGVQGGQVQLTAPITRTFGEGGNTQDDLAGQSVRFIRVPQYRKVTVEGTLTGPPLAGPDSADGSSTGGVLVFEANGRSATNSLSVISGSGTITMTGNGYRGAGKPTDTTPTPGPSNDWHWSNDVGAGALGWTGEGTEGLRDLKTSIALGTSSGGGAYCGSGDVHPAQYGPTGNPPGSNDGSVHPNQIDQLLFGASGSYATRGADSCGSSDPQGSGATYGDAMLGSLFLGAGSGSVSLSEAESCYDASHGCYRKTATAVCCNSGTSYGYDGNGVSAANVPAATYTVPSDCDRSKIYGCSSPGTCWDGSPNPPSWSTSVRACGSPWTCDPTATAIDCTTSGCPWVNGSSPNTPGPWCSSTCAGDTWFNYCDARTVLWKQSFAGAAGGGIILATFAELKVTGSGSIQANGLVATDSSGNALCNVGRDDSGNLGAPSYCYGGAGGTVYLRAESLDLGGVASRLQAFGGTSGALPGGGDGRIRLDNHDLNNAAPNGTWAKPLAATTALDGDTVRSVSVLSLATGSFLTAQAVVIPVGRPIPFQPSGNIDAGAALAATGLTFGLSADGWTTTAPVSADGTLTFVAPWKTSTAYKAGDLVGNFSNAYVCNADGTSASSGSGPQGTSTTINDGTTQWGYQGPGVYQGNTLRWWLSPATGQQTGSTRGFQVKLSTGGT